jgi:hypothetical protein
VTFEAEARWCRWSERLGMFEIGYRFCDLDDQTRQIVEKLIANWPVPDEEPAWL